MMVCNARLFICFLFLFITTQSFAQHGPGIVFEKELSWAEILEKARKENKYIFVDGYTTWCVPCRQMAQEIFPKEEVGEFFNQNFISVAVQFDVTTSDDVQTKRWYETAKALQATYKVGSYPTYLYFNPQGSLVHRLIGGTVSAGEFIEKSKLALDPQTQYVTLKQQYNHGNRDSAFLASLTFSAYALRDYDSLKYYAKDYLKLQHDLLSPANIRLAAAATSKTSDIGFAVLKDHPGRVDSIIGAGISRRMVKHIVSDEIVRPLTRLNLTITEYGGGMVVYGGELIPGVDWQLARNKLNLDYPDLSDEILRQAKIEHFRELKDWRQYIGVIADWHDYRSVDAADRDELNSYLRLGFEQGMDKEILKTALRWSARNMKADPSNISYQSTYNRLLYQSGKQKEAIKNMKIAVTKDSPYKAEALSVLEMMEKGEGEK